MTKPFSRALRASAAAPLWISGSARRTTGLLVLAAASAGAACSTPGTTDGGLSAEATTSSGSATSASTASTGVTTSSGSSGGAMSVSTASTGVTVTSGSGGGASTSSGSGGGTSASSGSGGGASASASSGAGGAAAPAVRLIGRFDKSTPDQPTFEWTGSSIEARFTGTSVSVILDGSANYFSAFVDGANEKTFATTGSLGTYPIATGLAAGTHTVLLYRLNEAFGNPNSFNGFDFGGGQLLAPPAPPAHAIEVIGDSISAGYGDECMGGAGFTPDMENGYLSYGAITGRDLGADVTITAWSGKGVYVNLDGTKTETMPILWQRTLPTDAASTWNFSQWAPGAVVINLGTNDFGANVAPADYESGYLALAQQVHATYPGASIFCALGPMLSDPSLSLARTAIGNVISAVKAGGFDKIQLVEFPTQDGSLGYGCDYHPSLATHQKMATLLEQAIHAALGW